MQRMVFPQPPARPAPKWAQRAFGAGIVLLYLLSALATYACSGGRHGAELSIWMLPVLGNGLCLLPFCCAPEPEARGCCASFAGVFFALPLVLAGIDPVARAMVWGLPIALLLASANNVTGIWAILIVLASVLYPVQQQAAAVARQVTVRHAVAAAAGLASELGEGAPMGWLGGSSTTEAASPDGWAGRPTGLRFR